MILAIHLTESGRQALSVVLFLIHATCSLGGAGLCAVGVFLRLSLREKVSLVQGYDGNVLPIVLITIGSLVALVNLVGGKVSFDISNPMRRKRLRCLLLVLIILLLVGKVLLLTAGIMCFVHRRHLSRSFHHGLIKAIGKYQEDYALKHEIDQLQMQYRCCGNSGYEDWFDIQWINNNFLDLQNSNVQSKMTSGQYLSDDVPFSCCRPMSPRPCIHHHVQDNAIHYNYDYETDLTLHGIGCKDRLMQYFGSSLNRIGGASMGLLALQVAAVVLARYLQTSITSAIESGDPEMASPGFLCGGGGADPSFPPATGRSATTRPGARPGSMEDFEAHGLGVDDEDDEDTYFTDSTFDDDYEEPVYENLPGPRNIRLPEPTYVNFTEPIYENLNETRYGNYREESAYDNEPIYANIDAFAAVPPPGFPGGPPQLPQTGPPPLRPTGPPPPRPTGPPPPRPTGPPPPRPSQPRSTKPGGAPPKRPNAPPSRPNAPPSRPNAPPKRPNASPKKSPKGPAPPRPNQPPGAGKGTTPKTSTPKKAKTNQGVKKGSAKQAGKKSSPNKKSPQTAKQTQGKGHKPSKSSSVKKSSPVKKSPKKVTKKSPRASKPAAKKMPSKPKAPRKSAGATRKKKSPAKGARKSRRPKSRNRNNNILFFSSNSSESETSDSSDSTIDSTSDSSSSEDSYDLETGSSSDESDASSDTPLLRR